MKNIFKFSMLYAFILCMVSCQNELDVPLSSIPSDDVTPNVTFVEALVVGAYAAMDGGNWQNAASNWVYGGVVSDNAYKGSDAGDQSDITEMETYQPRATNGFFNSRWRGLYEGINRANTALSIIESGLQSGDLNQSDANRLAGELRFLRGHYHFEAKKMWGNIPFVDENTTETPSNTIDAWPMIEADFQFAIDNLPQTNSVAGRVGSWAARAYLAKVHMYQLDYTAARPLLDDIINNGPYDLNESFHDNFNAATNNSIESIFAVQYALDDGAGPGQNNANYGDVLNFPHSASPFGCCGFYQPSHDLVNAYLTNGMSGLPAHLSDPATGLPLLGSLPTDPVDYVKSVEPNDIIGTDPQGNPIPRNADDDMFVPELRPLDPRLDWTVGRKGIPFNGWGDFAGLLWIRDASNGGPFMSKKNIWEASQDGSGGAAGNWGQQLSAINTNIIRYAEVLLWRAEVAVSEGDLVTAADFVDMVRERAANSAYFVKRDDGSDAANYVIGLYGDNGGFPDQAYAEEAILLEHRLEMALEGHRFFDLVRRGRANMILNTYLQSEQFRGYLEGASYTDDKGVYPIPQQIIDLAGGALTQNPGY